MNRLISPLLIISILILTGCDVPVIKVDQKERKKLFDSCMRLLPESPKDTVYNDWDEVVRECDNIARRQARRCVENCKDSGKYL